MRTAVRVIGGVLLGAAVFATGGILWGCNAGFLNPAFANVLSGGVVPLTPGPESQFVLVRVVNGTNDVPIEFVVTAERQLVVDEAGSFVTQTTTETHRLITFPTGNAAEMGLLLDCNPGLTRIGLGENLDLPNTDPGLFLNAAVAGTTGFGVPAGIAALDARAGNFECGDTVIFQAFTSSGSIGGVSVNSALLDFQSQPSQFVGRDTFLNARIFLELQVLNNE